MLSTLAGTYSKWDWFVLELFSRGGDLQSFSPSRDLQSLGLVETLGLTVLVQIFGPSVPTESPPPGTFILCDQVYCQA